MSLFFFFFLPSPTMLTWILTRPHPLQEPAYLLAVSLAPAPSHLLELFAFSGGHGISLIFYQLFPSVSITPSKPNIPRLPHPSSATRQKTTFIQTWQLASLCPSPSCSLSPPPRHYHPISTPPGLSLSLLSFTQLSACIP